MMADENLDEKTDSCSWYGTPQCPHRSAMKAVTAKPINRGNELQIEKAGTDQNYIKDNAKFCENCPKYQEKK